MTDFKTLSVGFVGAGRVGAPLGRALQNAGYRIGSVAGASKESRARSRKLLPSVPVRLAEEVARENEILFLAVPDHTLEKLVQELSQVGALRHGQYVLHTAGSKGLSVFDGVRQKIRPVAFHPAMTFTGSRYDVRRLVGATYGVTVRGNNGRLSEARLARTLAADLQGSVVMLDEQQRSLYHAALTHGANYLVTLVEESFAMLEQAGIEDAKPILEPLLSAALGNALFKRGEALTGPISRGDDAVVQQHRRSLREAMPEVLPVYDALGIATVGLASKLSRITEAQREELLQSLREDPE